MQAQDVCYIGLLKVIVMFYCCYTVSYLLAAAVLH
jgi:hypothetical protein